MYDILLKDSTLLYEKQLFNVNSVKMKFLKQSAFSENINSTDYLGFVLFTLYWLVIKETILEFLCSIGLPLKFINLSDIND